MVFARLQGEFKIGTEKRAATLGNEFFAGIAFIAPALAPDDKSFTLEQHRTGKRSRKRSRVYFMDKSQSARLDACLSTAQTFPAT